jgi:hypothetical protein
VVLATMLASSSRWSAGLSVALASRCAIPMTHAHRHDAQASIKLHLQRG